MQVRAKKSLGQHFLTDQSIAQSIVAALQGGEVLEVGPGMGVLTQYLLKRPGTVLKAVEIDDESVVYLRRNFPELGERLIEGDFLKMDLAGIFPSSYSVIGNFPYNISSQIFFKILERRDQIPEVVCMIQKEVAQRIAERPGTKTYGILSVFLQAWYDIEYLFTVGSGAFNPPPKVQSAVIRLTRNSRASLGCDEKLFRTIVKTSFGQRRKTLRNSLKSLAQTRLSSEPASVSGCPSCSGTSDAVADPAFYDNSHLAIKGENATTFLADPVFDLRPERLGVEDFINLTNRFQ